MKKLIQATSKPTGAVTYTVSKGADVLPRRHTPRADGEDRSSASAVERIEVRKAAHLAFPDQQAVRR